MSNNNAVNLNISSPTITGTTNINATGSGATTIGNSSGGALTIASNGNSTWAISNQSFTLTTGTGNINIGADITSKSINIGSTTTTQIIFTSGGMILNSGTTAATNVSITKSGTGNLLFTQTGTGQLQFTGPGTIAIADTTVPTSIQFGNRATAVNGTIGNATSTSSLTFHTGSGNINIGIASVAKTITMNGGGVSASTFKLNTGTGGINYPSSEITTTSATLIPGIAYTSNNASQVTFTLPTTVSVGVVFKICGYGAGGWKIAQNSGQQISSSVHNTTSGATGSLSSGGRYDSVEIICITANTTFTIKDSQGTLTFV